MRQRIEDANVLTEVRRRVMTIFCTVHSKVELLAGLVPALSRSDSLNGEESHHSQALEAVILDLTVAQCFFHLFESLGFFT